ncbi:hypothetical protein [Candidatus Contendibacter odensensis]|uniref:SCP domain-containing protein n=1 Tax=Candidatus Contendobacter odensis Run_B_J11 TaxID=1400861 RepID=A0A7U7GEK9_9GAMM|nr:hypothetical protein [Candidatus Contendobacter odensis]CDH46426.1 exported hypothetical protein [Candidatus Contendobacter odensis Run_B_J11]
MKMTLLIASGLLVGTTAFASASELLHMAEPDPPLTLDLEYPVLLQLNPVPFVTAAPAAEWTYHRTADGQHPNGDEQALVWLMNRARRDPAAEGRWLATEPNSDVASGRSYFQVNTNLLQSEFASYAAKPPAAFDARLYQAAKMHSDDLISRDAQDHNQQFDQITAAGFRFTLARGSVFSYATSALNTHAAWNIDWGPGDGSGMQPGRGHRMGLMAIDFDYTNVGLAAVAETNPATAIGPLVVTGNYCYATENGVDQFNVFLVGTVWQDKDKNGRYDPGEGYGNVMVQPSQGTYYAMTAAGGGYAIPVTASGALTVNFSGGGVPSASRNVTVSGSSVLLDYQIDAAGPTPTPLSTLLTNISTRGWVGTGDSVMIGGFIISGSAAKKVLITAKGPTLTQSGVPSVLNDPNITLHNASGQPILSNDNWGTAANAAEIQAHPARPRYAQEAAILTTLNPGAYTAIVRGAGSTTGNALVEVYDLEAGNTTSRLVNISTRGWVGTGDSVMIGGFIISGNAAKKVLITAKGPALAQAGVPSVLNDPNITLHNASGQAILSNDDWGTAVNAAEIQAHPARPRYAQEAAILTTLNPGAYTAIVRGADATTGNALVEVYEVQ